MAASTPSDLTQALNERTILVALQAREQRGRHRCSPWRSSLRRVRRGATALIHVDAVQAAPRTWPSTSAALGADLRLAGRPQVRGTQGHRGALDPARHGDPAPGPWRQPGALPAGGHGERGGCGGHGRRLRARHAERAKTVAATSRRVRDRLRTRPGDRGRGAHRPSDRAAAQARSRSSSAGSTATTRHGPRPRGHRLLHRLRLHDRVDSSPRTS